MHNIERIHFLIRNNHAMNKCIKLEPIITKSQKITPSSNNPSLILTEPEVEEQLNNELKVRQRTLRIVQRFKQIKICKEYNNHVSDKKLVEDLNKWEIDKIGDHETSDYGDRIKNIIYEHIKGYSDDMLKNDWEIGRAHV